MELTKKMPDGTEITVYDDGGFWMKKPDGEELFMSGKRLKEILFCLDNMFPKNDKEPGKEKPETEKGK